MHKITRTHRTMSKMVVLAFIAVLSLLSAAASEVFFSCRGDDTRSSFTDHLHAALRQARIYAFREEDGIPIGENIGLASRRAINESQLSAIVLSKEHAASERCLNELLIIMARKMTDAGYLVLPVFYHVDPSDVAEQTGAHGEVFAGHEKRLSQKMDMVEKRKAALKEVGNLQGIIIFKNSYESQCIQNIVQEIGNKLKHREASSAPFHWDMFFFMIKLLVSILVIILVIFFKVRDL